MKKLMFIFGFLFLGIVVDAQFFEEDEYNIIFIPQKIEVSEIKKEQDSIVFYASFFRKTFEDDPCVLKFGKKIQEDTQSLLSLHTYLKNAILEEIKVTIKPKSDNHFEVISVISEREWKKGEKIIWQKK
jgi:hypothetical protein